MKKITLILFLFAISNLFAQNQLLSSIEEFYDGTTWSNNSGSDYSYNANGNLQQETSYFWDSNINSWMPSYADVYLYNSANRVTQSLYRVYNNNSLQFEDDERTNYTYNGASQLTALISQDFTNGQWVNDYRDTYNYTSNRITSLTEQSWNGLQWVDEYRSTLTYNASGNVISLIDEKFQNGQWQNDYRILLTYNSNQKVMSNTYETWDGSSWVLDETANYTYDSNLNRLIETYIYNGGGYREGNVFDTAIALSTLGHPFRDKTGIDFILFGNPYVNKILIKNEFDYDSTTMTFETAPSYRTTYNYNSTLSVNEEIADSLMEIKLFPNPTSNLLTVEATNNVVTQIALYDVLGKEVLVTDKTTFAIGSLSDGVYIVKVIDELGHKTIHKIVKN